MEPRKLPNLFSIRPASNDDMAKVFLIERTAARSMGIDGWTQKQFESEFVEEQSRILVITDDETDEQLVGYIAYRISTDFVEIMNLAVHEDFRGMGWGKKLIHEVVKDAMRKKLKKVFLEVRKSNTPAVELYQTLRFDIIRVRKGYYKTAIPPGNEDAYEMELDLTNTGLGLSG